MRSPRSLVPLLGWLAATLTSIVLASVAMLPVLRTATRGDGGLISADQLRRSGVGDPIPLPSVPSASTPARPPATSTPATRPTGGPEEDDETQPTPGTTGPARTTTPPPPPPTSTSPAAKPETRVVDGWAVTTGGDGAETYVRSFPTDGGQAVLRIRNGRVEVVTATPANGFEVAVVQNVPESLAVYFNEPSHSFIVHAGWNVDRPFAQVDEVG